MGLVPQSLSPRGAGVELVGCETMPHCMTQQCGMHASLEV